MAIYETRPSDWSPLTGGDPCPGNPPGWLAAQREWESRAALLDSLAMKLGPTVSVDAESDRIRRIETVAREGQDSLRGVAREYHNAAAVVGQWIADLSELQAAADEALKKAKAAELVRDDAYFLLDILAATSLDDLALTHEESQRRKADLEHDISEANVAIASAQSTVYAIRNRYEQIKAGVIDCYTLVGVAAQATLSRAAAVLGRSSDAVAQALVGFGDITVHELRGLAENAGSGPTEYSAYLDALRSLPAEALVAFYESHPEFARYPLSSTGDVVWESATVKAWWENLPEEHRRILVSEASGMIGNLNGVPYSVRDQANRKNLDVLLFDSTLDEATRAALVKLQEASNSPDRRRPHFILSLDISNSRIDDGFDENNVLAAVSVGNVDEADATTVMVPGMGNNVERSITDLTGNVQSMYSRQSEELRNSDKKIAVIAFMGYDTPNLAGSLHTTADRRAAALRGVPVVDNGISQSVLSADLAEGGGQNLAHFYDALNVTKSSNRGIPEYGSGPTDAYNDTFISLNAHSYGTTTTAEALGLSQTKVDNAVFYGSAGLTKEAIDKANRGEWALEQNSSGQQNLTLMMSGEDFLAPTGALGSGRQSPSNITFAVEFEDDPLIDVTGKYWEDVDHHPVATTQQKLGLTLITDPGFGTQQGYWSDDAVTLLRGSQASLEGVMATPPKYLEPYYIEIDSVTGLETYYTVTPEQLEEASAQERQELLQKMMTTQGITIEELQG